MCLYTMQLLVARAIVHMFSADGHRAIDLVLATVLELLMLMTTRLRAVWHIVNEPFMLFC